MRLYRVAKATEGGEPGSGGFEWFSAKRPAMARATEYKRDAPDECDPEVTVVDIRAGKIGLLDALRRYASHADNG